MLGRVQQSQRSRPMSPPHYVGYEDDPLPPDRFRMSFGPPKRKPKRQPDPVPLAPPRPVIVPPRPRMVAPAAAAPVAPKPAAAPPRPRPQAPVWTAAPTAAPARLPPPPEAAARAEPEQAARAMKVLRPQLEPRGQQVTSFPTWKPLPAPVVRLPVHPVAAVEDVARALPAPALLALRVVGALLLLAPLGWLGGWFGLPATAADFLMTGLGRLAWRALGGPDAMVLYWVLLFPAALALSFIGRLAWSLLTLGVFYWSWDGLHHLLGMPAPWTPW